MTQQAKASIEGAIVLMVALIAVLAIAIFLAGRPDGPRAAASLKVPVRDDAMPGNAIPPISCYMTAGSTDFLVCVDGRQEIDLVIQPKTRRIAVASYMDMHDTVGDVFLTWGRPNGYMCDGTGYTFFYNDRSFYVVPRYGLSLFSIVGFVTYGSPDIDYRPMGSMGLPVSC